MKHLHLFTLNNLLSYVIFPNMDRAVIIFKILLNLFDFGLDSLPGVLGIEFRVLTREFGAYIVKLTHTLLKFIVPRNNHRLLFIAAIISTCGFVFKVKLRELARSV